MKTTGRLTRFLLPILLGFAQAVAEPPGTPGAEQQIRELVRQMRGNGSLAPAAVSAGSVHRVRTLMSAGTADGGPSAAAVALLQPVAVAVG